MTLMRDFRQWGELAFLSSIVPLLLAACADPQPLPQQEPPPPAPRRVRIRTEVAETQISAAAARLLHDLLGKCFADDEKVFGGGTWTVGVLTDSTYLTSNSNKRRGANIVIEQDNARRHLPMEADGDVADFYHRVVGVETPDLTGSFRSPAYDIAITAGK